MSSILKQALVIVAISVAGVYYLNSRADDLDTPPEEDVTIQAETAPLTLTSANSLTTRSASVVSIPRKNGHFYTYGQVNRGSINFLVDTGASVVALTKADARKAGIRMNDLVYDRPVQTAGGRTYAAAVNLERVSIGGIHLRNVQGVVMQDGLGQSLLGMSFLGELQKVEATPNMLTLRF